MRRITGIATFDPACTRALFRRSRSHLLCSPPQVEARLFLPAAAVIRRALAPSHPTRSLSPTSQFMRTIQLI